MATHNETIFAKTIQKSNIWLGELQELLHASDAREAYVALRAGLHALRDRLTIEEAAELGAQLPMLLRGLYYEGWHPTGKPVRLRHLDDFLDYVRNGLPANSSLDPESVAWAVFRTLSLHVTEGELADIRSTLPTQLKLLWSAGTIDEMKLRARKHVEHTGWSR